MYPSRTNLYKNITLIVILVAALLYQRDESKVVDYIALEDQEALSGDYQKESLEYQVRLGFSEQGRRRLQQSANDSRQL